MIGSVERYSSSAGKKKANVAGSRFLRILIVAIVLYLVVSRFLVSTYRIESVSMRPGLSPSDRVIVSGLSFGPRVPFSHTRLPGLGTPERGDLVVVQPPFLEEPALLSRILEPLVNFFTLQRATLHRNLHGARVNGFMVKRIVGLPGDTVRLRSYIASIKPRGASDFVSEQQLIPGRYRILTESPAPGWTASMPLSGNGSEIVLQSDEYFVLGDNRAESSDSRSWGAIGADRIVGKVIYRYWPPRSIGSP
jgi:signal peptidase I